MGLKIHDYSKNIDLNEAITRYYTLMRMSLDSTNIYKIIETTTTQILRFHGAVVPQLPQDTKDAIIDFQCPKCKTHYKLQARLNKDSKIVPGKLPFPKNDIFTCPSCKQSSNLAPIRLQIEAQSGKKVIA